MAPKFRVQKSAGKVLASIFWDQDGIFLIDYLPKDQTINAEYYSSLLVQLKDILKEKRRGAWRSPRGSCSCTTMLRLTRHMQPRKEKLAYLGFQLLDHPLYSPDLAPSDYDLFSGLKKTTERSPFFFRRGGHCCRGDLVGWTTFWIFLSGLQKLQQRAKKCIELRGEYVVINPEIDHCNLFSSWSG